MCSRPNKCAAANNCAKPVEGAPHGGRPVAAAGAGAADLAADVGGVVQGRGGGGELLLEDAVPGVQRREVIDVGADVLGGAEEEEPAGAEGVVEDGQDAALQGGVHVDEDVAAAGEVDVRE